MHREIARKLHPAFSARSLKAQESTLNRHIDELVRKIQEHGTKERGINVKEVRHTVELFHEIMITRIKLIIYHSSGWTGTAGI